MKSRKKREFKKKIPLATKARMGNPGTWEERFTWWEYLSACRRAVTVVQSLILCSFIYKC